MNMNINIDMNMNMNMDMDMDMDIYQKALERTLENFQFENIPMTRDGNCLSFIFIFVLLFILAGLDLIVYF